MLTPAGDFDFLSGVFEDLFLANFVFFFYPTLLPLVNFFFFFFVDFDFGWFVFRSPAVNIVETAFFFFFFFFFCFIEESDVTDVNYFNYFNDFYCVGCLVFCLVFCIFFDGFDGFSVSRSLRVNLEGPSCFSS